MSKMRNVEHLQDKLDAEIAWRKKELTTLKFLIETNSQKTGRIDCLIRGGVTLLYAHWEGFIKEASKYYLEYVVSQKKPYNELTYNFIALGLKRNLYDFTVTNKPSNYISILYSLLEKQSDECIIAIDSAIDTQSNLSSHVLKDITQVLGLDFTVYETKSKLIDEQLLSRRNTIAHGQNLLITTEEYLEIHENVIIMLQLFLNQISNAASMKQYLRMGINA